MVPVRELPYGPAASDAASEAGQMAASDHVHYLQKSLASVGASTDGKQSFAKLDRLAAFGPIPLKKSPLAALV